MTSADSPKPEKRQVETNSSSGNRPATETDLAPILEDLPPSQREAFLKAVERDPQILGIALSVRTSSSWQGPLPRPRDLRAFGEISADLPDRIMSMAEREQLHRHAVDKHDLAITSRGQCFAFAVAMLAIAGGFVLILLGRPLEGGIFGGTPLVLLIVAFLRGNFARQSPASPGEETQEERRRENR